jgi:hypothetical protein
MAMTVFMRVDLPLALRRIDRAFHSEAMSVAEQGSAASSLRLLQSNAVPIAEAGLNSLASNDDLGVAVPC